MRILFAITKGEIGGAQEHLRILARGLRALGHHVGVVLSTPSPLAEQLPDCDVIPWEHIVRNPNPRNDVRARNELRLAAKHFRPDVLHLYSAKAGVLGRGLIRPPAGITIYTCHHAPYGPARKVTHRLIGRPVEQLTLRYVDGIISDGSRDLPLIRKIAGRVPTRLIPNAVAIYGPPRAPTSPTRTALWVARMAHPKDPLLAIRAWGRVGREYSDATLTLCGEGPLIDDVRAMAARSVVGKQLACPGRVPDLGPYYERSSLFLLVSHVEGGVTMATLEAMAEGLVPVLSDVGDAFLVEHAGAGVIAARGSARAHADAVAGIFDSPDRFAAMRLRSIQFARDRWTTAAFVDATEAFYREVAGR